MMSVARFIGRLSWRLPVILRALAVDCARRSPWRRIRRVTETIFYLASSFCLGVATGLLVVGIGLWMLRTQLSLASAGEDAHTHDAEHEHAHGGHTHAHGHGHDHVHSHGWGVRHSHRVDLDAVNRPRLPILL